MTDQPQTTIVPTRRDVEAWRLSAEWFIKFGGIKLGEFNWPQAVLSLAAEWEKNNAQEGSAHLRALLLKLGSGVQAMTQAYLLTVRQAPRALTDGDIESGNTREYQDGFVDALEVVAAEHVKPLVTIYNDVMKELAA
jgi:hypothetical protein